MAGSGLNLSLEEVIAHISKPTTSNITSTTATTDVIGSTDTVMTALNEVVTYSEQNPLHEVRVGWLFHRSIGLKRLFARVQRIPQDQVKVKVIKPTPPEREYQHL